MVITIKGLAQYVCLHLPAWSVYVHLCLSVYVLPVVAVRPSESLLVGPLCLCLLRLLVCSSHASVSVSVSALYGGDVVSMLPLSDSCQSR